MFTFRNLKPLILLAASFLVLQSSVVAQSGRTPPPLPAPLPALTPAPTPEIDTTNFEKVKLIVSRGLDGFVKELNEQGRFGYRVEKSVSYGDTGERRQYAAVLHLDPGHRYEYVYDWLPSQALYGHPLNYRARQGYNFVEAYTVAQCPPVKVVSDSSDPYDPDNLPVMKMLNTVRRNVFLFVRRDGATEQTSDYKLLRGRIGLGEDFQETIQAPLDVTPAGYRAVRFLFVGPGLIGSEVSVLLERNLGEIAPAKVEYRVVKETRDLMKELSQLAADGAGYVSGGRNGPFKVALLARRAAAGTSDYTFLDDNKAAKKFDKLVAAGYSYQGMMGGNLECESSELVSQKLVFAREATGQTRRYKLLNLPEPKLGKPSPAALSELQRLAGEGFQVREIFYAYGLHVILEKQPEARDSQAQTRARAEAAAVGSR